MTRQIEQLKEEIQSKDTSLVREHFEQLWAHAGGPIYVLTWLTGWLACLLTQVREHFEHMKVAQEKEQLKEALAAIVKKEEDMAAEEGAFKAEVRLHPDTHPHPIPNPHPHPNMA
jgi:hypothetical protein